MQALSAFDSGDEESLLKLRKIWQSLIGEKASGPSKRTAAQAGAQAHAKNERQGVNRAATVSAPSHAGNGSSPTRKQPHSAPPNSKSPSELQHATNNTANTTERSSLQASKQHGVLPQSQPTQSAVTAAESPSKRHKSRPKPQASLPSTERVSVQPTRPQHKQRSSASDTVDRERQPPSAASVPAAKKPKTSSSSSSTPSATASPARSQKSAASPRAQKNAAGSARYRDHLHQHHRQQQQQQQQQQQRQQAGLSASEPRAASRSGGLSAFDRAAQHGKQSRVTAAPVGHTQAQPSDARSPPFAASPQSPQSPDSPGAAVARTSSLTFGDDESGNEGARVCVCVCMCV